MPHRFGMRVAAGGRGWSVSPVSRFLHSTSPGTTWTRRTLLRHRSLLVTSTIAAAIILCVGWWSQRAVQRTIEGRLQGELKTAIEANVTALDLWIQGQMRTTTLLANDPSIRDPANTLIAQSTTRTNATTGFGAGPGNGPGGAGFGRADPTHTAFARALDERLALAGYQAAVLLGTNGRVIGASGRMRARPGMTVPADHLELFHRVLTNGKPALVTPFKPVRRIGRGPGSFVERRPGDRGPGPSTQTPAVERPAGSPPMEEAGGGFRPGPPSGESFAGRNGPPPGGMNRGELQVMQVLTPIRNAAGDVAGVLAVVIRPEAEFTRVLSVARAGTSGETFAFDHEGRILSQSRFDAQLQRLGLVTNTPGASSALNLILRDPGGNLLTGHSISAALSSNSPLMRLVSDALSGSSGVTVQPVRDYRGVDVVGAWHWLDEHQFGVVTKIDSAEAYQPLRVLRLIFQILVLLVLLATIAGVVASHIGSTWRRRFDEAQLRARQLGQYTLLEKIGEGAMGVVYRARHALLRRETAVKLLLPDRSDDEIIQQFEHEVQLTCRLTHPNTIQVFDYGHTADGIFYYAMELLEGLTLQDLADRHGGVPEERAIHILRQAAESLAEAHAAGLIHRDIKPGNLFLCERGGMPDTVKVLDFGLVRDLAHDRQALAPGEARSRFVGTPLYMAPETIRNPGHGDAASDLYALGAVAYLLVTGQPVFSAGSVEMAWEMHANAIPVPPGRRAQVPLSAELESLILDCLAKSPADRPAGMNAFLERLARCPKTNGWTPEKRRLWWREHVLNSPLTATEAPDPKTIREVEATIRIDLSSRS
jgi:eukaryotic-like serine/threonine-protein kinase